MDIQTFEICVKLLVSNDHYRQFEYLLPDVKHYARFLDCLKAGYRMDDAYAISNEVAEWDDYTFYTIFNTSMATVDRDAFLEVARYYNLALRP